MNADAGDGYMILQRRLPAGRHAPRHAFAPHLTATLREQNTSRTRPPRREGRVQITNLGRAALAHRLESPEHPPRRPNPNAAAPRGQFTVSYRVLPFSGRTAVRTLPKNRAGLIFRAVAQARAVSAAYCKACRLCQRKFSCNNELTRPGAPGRSRAATRPAGLRNAGGQFACRRKKAGMSS